MKWIEFVAPSGAGKTTLLNTLKKERFQQDWVTEQEAIAEIVLNKRTKGVKERLMQKYLNQRVLHVQKKQVQFSLLQESKAFLSKSHRYEQFIRLFFEYLQDTDLSERFGRREWSEKAFYLKWYLSLIEKLCLFDYHKFAKIVVLDEGIMHNNHYSSRIKQKGDVNLPVGLIFMDLSITTIYKQLLKRKEETGERRLHKGMGDLALEAYLNRERRVMLQKLEAAKGLNIPHIVLTENKNFEETLRKSNEFLSRF